MDEQRDKIKDLEVKDDEARDIGGGKKIQAKSRGAKAAKRGLTVPPIAGKKDR